MSGIVAIVGRPNVGKSTLFNRLTGQRQAIVDDVSGVTRDRHYAKAEWGALEYTLIDTGGYVVNSEDLFESSIRKQVELALEEADVLLFVVDVTTEITDLDDEFLKVLRKTNKPVLCVVNKCDNADRLLEANVFYSLGFEEVYPISANSGSGTGELLDSLSKLLPKETIEAEEQLPRIALVGRPNVGKSSLCNALLGEERNIVTDIAGTTRDTIHTHYNAYGKEFIMVDTAGVRRKSRVSENVEFYSVMRSIRAIEDSDVILLVIDAQLGFESQDVNLFSLAQKNGKGIVILVNKWDLIEKDHRTVEAYKQKILTKIEPFVDVPVLFISATQKLRIYQAVEEALKVHESMKRRISTSKLNDLLLPIIEKTPPPSRKGKYIRIKYVTQLPSQKTSFAFFCNLPQYIDESYRRFLENRLREHFDFKGVPINIFFRKK
jgi:GTP-binding protein